MFDYCSLSCNIYEISVKQVVHKKLKEPSKGQLKQEMSNFTVQSCRLHWSTFCFLKTLSHNERVSSFLGSGPCLSSACCFQIRSSGSVWETGSGSHVTMENTAPRLHYACVSDFTTNDQHTQTCLLDNPLSWQGSNGEADKLLTAANKGARDEHCGTHIPDYLSWQMIRWSAGSYMPSVFTRRKCSS